jgi:hypothetical protein
MICRLLRRLRSFILWMRACGLQVWGLARMCADVENIERVLNNLRTRVAKLKDDEWMYSGKGSL